MLSPPDADLIRRDTSLPGLATLLDPEAFVDLLRRRLPAAGIRDATITYVRYKPRMNCLVTYRLEGDGKAVTAYAKTHGPDAPEKLGKVREKIPAPTPLGQGRLALEEVASVLFLFPNDAKLPALRELADAQAWNGRLRKLLPGRPDVWPSAAQPLAYKPERRYVARIGTPESPAGVVKYYTEHGYAQASANAKKFRSRGPLRIARRIAKSRRHRILVFEWLPGRLVSEVISDPEPDAGLLGAVGAALADLHAQDPGGLPDRTRKAEAEGVLALAEEIAFVCPACGEKARSVARRLSSFFLDEPPVGGAVHGDFYAKQVLVEDRAVSILDLDRAMRGDPAADMGTFLAHLERDALRGSLLPGRIEPMKTALLDGYRSAAGTKAPSRAGPYSAAALFGLALEPFRYREPEWPGRIDTLLSRAGAILDDARGNNAPVPRFVPPSPSAAEAETVVSVHDPFGASSDPEMPFLAEAVDPTRVRELFSGRLPHLRPGRTASIPLLAIRVTRHKPGRRALVEYDLRLEGPGAPSGVVTLIGKARAKGVDRANYDLLLDLRKEGFADVSADGIAIPEPVGVVTELRMWLQRKVPGVPATHLLAKPGWETLVGRIAEAIHKVHRTGLVPRRRHTMADEIAILRERLETLARVKPQWAGRLEHVLAGCERLGASVPEPEYCGIHRDFYPDQVLVDGERLYLLDFDLFCEGDPGLDAGNFIAHLTEQSLRTLGRADALADREDALEQAFLRLAGVRRRPAVRAYSLLTLARHISISTQIPDRASVTEPLLDLCERRLEDRERTSRDKGERPSSPRVP